MRFLRILLLVIPCSAYAETASELHLALKKLSVVGSAFYVAAHPDDENTALLAWLEDERLLRAAYLSLTRGDGGQNLIGDEKSELLGVLRTQELLSARRIDGAEQFFTRAIDFGYSKTAQETLAIWDRDAVLADVVWVIRRFQPDVIITRFPTTGEGGHGHHTASAILAEEAFRAAADPTRFPEQIRFAGPWQAKRIFWNRFSFQRTDAPAEGDLRIDLGTYNPLLGRSYTEVAAQSRSQHKSQGFGAAERRGSIINYFKQTGGEPAANDLFEGIDLTWSRYAAGERVGTLLRQAAETFEPANPHKSIPVLLQALSELDRLPERSPWFAAKREELLDAIRLAGGISIDVSAGDSVVVPGGEIPVAVTVVNRSDFPFVLAAVASPYANPGKVPGVGLKYNQPVRTEISIKLPANYDYSQPYWLRRLPTKGMFGVDDQMLIGLAENPPSIPITVSLTSGATDTLTFTVPGVFRWTDPVKGEQIRSVDVVPEVTANFGANVYVFPERQPRQVGVWLRTHADVKSATVRLKVPEGWRSEPASRAVQFEGKGDEERIAFTVTPPAAAATDQISVEVELPSGKKITLGSTEIDYPHIAARRVFGDSAAKVVRADIRKSGQRVGYIMGSGDDVPAALRQIGYEVTLLSDADLDRGDFRQFDAIVAGVRAYNTRKRLRLVHARLMQYVENGGTYVVQYNTRDDLAVATPGPYPFTISRDRVAVEEAPVRMVRPQHTLLTTPNKIGPNDFDEWVQERGLYFAGEWDPRYQTVLSTNDPGEKEKEGGQLYARHGKGVFVYTSYSWFRQLPAGVPGAYRLFANLVSAK